MKNIFEVAQKLNKKIVFIIYENRVFVTLAEKSADNTITLKVKKEYGDETIKLKVSPEQEFILYSPKITLEKVNSIFDYIINLNLKDREVLFTLEPYRVECLFLVYPYELLSNESLKNLSLIKVKEAKEKEITIDVYSPTIYALDTITIKKLSATSRLSQIDTILHLTKELLTKAEGLLKTPETSSTFLNIIRNPRFLILIVLISLLVFTFLMLPNLFNIIAGMQQVIPKPTLNITPTFP
ncbi:MAG: hypothetical protein QW184_00740 [Nanopusillaceae archaeon]